MEFLNQIDPAVNRAAEALGTTRQTNTSFLCETRSEKSYHAKRTWEVVESNDSFSSIMRLIRTINSSVVPRQAWPM
jgi:hypothetical protein